MSNIVERLRDCSKYGAYQQGQPGRLMGEAADEIERLWAMAQRDEKSYQAEIERLRAAHKEIIAECEGHTLDNEIAYRVGSIARRALEPKP